MEQECPVGGSLRLCVSEVPPLVVKEGGLAFPLCPSCWHGLELIDALSEPGVDHLLEVINEAYIAKSRDGPVNLELSDEFLYGAVTLAQGGELPPSGCLAVQVCEHLIKLYCELHPHSFTRVHYAHDLVDSLGCPAATRASFH